MRTAIDTSALFALLYPSDTHNERAKELLGTAARSGAVVITPPVYTELAADSGFGSQDSLDKFLDETGIELSVPTTETRYTAGQAFRRYLDRRGDALQCSVCGTETVFDCPDCGSPVSARRHVPSDFVIGAHAEQEADALVTFDAGFFRDYFEVEIRALTD